MNLQTVRRLLLALPGVEEGPCYGTPGFRLRGELLARRREDGEQLAVQCGDDERDLRMHTEARLPIDPAAFVLTMVP